MYSRKLYPLRCDTVHQNNDNLVTLHQNNAINILLVIK